MTDHREPLVDRLGRDAFLSTFLAGNRFTDDLDRLCRAEGISHPQYTALWALCLANAPDGLPMGALVDGLLHRKADATRLVDRLVDEGYVSRAPSPEDRRTVLVKPTKAGRELFVRLTEQIKAMHRRQWAALDNDELKQLIHLLNKALWAHQPMPANVASVTANKRQLHQFSEPPRESWRPRLGPITSNRPASSRASITSGTTWRCDSVWSACSAAAGARRPVPPGPRRRRR